MSDASICMSISFVSAKTSAHWNISLERRTSRSSDTSRSIIPFSSLRLAGHDQSPFTKLIQRLIENNGQLRIQAVKIHRLVSQGENSHRFLLIDGPTLESIESIIRNLNRLAKTFESICSGLSTQILMLAGNGLISDV